MTSALTESAYALVALGAPMVAEVQGYGTVYMVKGWGSANGSKRRWQGGEPWGHWLSNQHVHSIRPMTRRELRAFWAKST